MSYRYAAYTLGITRAFTQVWNIIDSRPDSAQSHIDRLKRLARKQYRLLAKSRHPDHGGSHAQMAELNLAMECLEGLDVPAKITPCPPITHVKVTVNRATTSLFGQPGAIRVYYRQK